MSESFAELFESSLANTNMKPGSILMGTVMEINDDYVVVNAGLKSEGVIPASQFVNESGDMEVAIGDTVEVALDVVEEHEEVVAARARERVVVAQAVLHASRDRAEQLVARDVAGLVVDAPKPIEVERHDGEAIAAGDEKSADGGDDARLVQQHTRLLSHAREEDDERRSARSHSARRRRRSERRGRGRRRWRASSRRDDVDARVDGAMRTKRRTRRRLDREMRCL